ncbi:MAG: polyprenyl synthetase family protein [Eubacteriales bacterium]
MSYWANYKDIQEELTKVENYMKKTVVSRNKELTNITLNLIEAGGKRLRPAFVIISAMAGKRYKEDIVIPLAASIELIHTATLVHDDIIDEASFRRGRKSVQHKWGRDMAIYVGDYLLTKSFLVLSEETSFERINTIAKFIKGICEGEIHQYQNRYKLTSTYQYLKNIYRKTAILFGMSIGIGAYEGGIKNASTRRSMINYGIYYGLAFQIYDDLLDYTSNKSLIGKPVGNDLKHGYYTLPILYAIEDKKYGDQIKELLNNQRNLTNQELNNIFELLAKTNAIEQTKELLNKIIKKARESIKLLRNKKVKPILEDLITRLEI